MYANAWTNADYWVKTVSDTYSQGLSLAQVVPFTSSTAVNMQSTVLTTSTPISLTLTSKHYSIFTPFSTAIANLQDSCDTPFTYEYQRQYNITVLWCQLIQGAVNQVVISYPYYPNIFGAGFPFSALLAYAIAEVQGGLIAFRT